jgi:hypothetical protein
MNRASQIGLDVLWGRRTTSGYAKLLRGKRCLKGHQPCRAEVGNRPRSTRHHGRVPEVDDDQLAALRRLRAALGPIEVVEVVSNDPGDDLAAPQGEPTKETTMAADPRRMTPEEQARPTRCWSRRSAIRTGKPPARPSTSWCASCWWCTGCWRPRSASPSTSRQPSRRNGCSCPSVPSSNRSRSAGGVPLGPPAGAARSGLQAAARATWSTAVTG